MAFDPKLFRKRVLERQPVAGAWLNLGSSITAEIAARSGLDWVLIDTEHGVGEHEALVPQLQAVSGNECAAIVRVSINDPVRFKRVLDLGADGVMVPWVGSVSEATDAVAAVRYPPRGIRGAASGTRVTGFTKRPFLDYWKTAHEEVVTLIQIEREEALNEVEEIAAIDGVDVLFVGPLDLSISLGIPQQYDHPDFLRALERISKAAEGNGKAAGILITDKNQIPARKAGGYTFLANGSDGAMVSQGMRKAAAALRDLS